MLVTVFFSVRLKVLIALVELVTDPRLNDVKLNKLSVNKVNVDVSYENDLLPLIMLLEELLIVVV